MKRNYWKTEGEYWAWEKTGEVYIYGLSGVTYIDIETVVSTIADVIKEFKLPLTIKSGNKYKEEDLTHIENTIRDCLYEGKNIDFHILERKLEKMRIENRILPYGIIILVDDTQYKFKDPKAIYGSGSAEGLIVIRKRYIDDATKHEFGHMIGLGSHHENCVMSYAGTYDQFCERCRREIKEIWTL